MNRALLDLIGQQRQTSMAELLRQRDNIKLFKEQGWLPEPENPYLSVMGRPGLFEQRGAPPPPGVPPAIPPTPTRPPPPQLPVGQSNYQFQQQAPRPAYVPTGGSAVPLALPGGMMNGR